MTDAVTLELSIRRYEGFAALDPDNPHIQMKLGDLYHSAGRLDDAMKCFERCAQSEDHAATGQSRMASVHLSAHRFEKAEALLAALVREVGSIAALHYNLGLACLHQGKWSDADKSFAQAMNLGLNTEAIYDCRTRTQHHLGQFEDALQIGRQWIAAFPTPKAFGYVATVALDGGLAEEAAALAERAIQLNDDSPFAHAVLGMIALTNNSPASAKEHFRKTVTVDPDSPQGWFGLGIIHLQNMETDVALASLTRANALATDDPLILLSLELARILANRPRSSTKEWPANMGTHDDAHVPHLEDLFNDRPPTFQAVLDAIPRDSDTSLALHRILSQLLDTHEATDSSRANTGADIVAQR